jgi:hypothetical protein
MEPHVHQPEYGRMASSLTRSFSTSVIAESRIAKPSAASELDNVSGGVSSRTFEYIPT